MHIIIYVAPYKNLAKALNIMIQHI